jgi:predicted MFS family arabinose efflux permease
VMETGVRRALRAPTFRLELLAYTLVSASMGVATVVVSVAMFRRGGTTLWATVGVVSRVAPFVLFSAFSGAIADRLDQRRVLQAAFAVQVVIAGVLAATVTSAPLAVVAAIGFAGQAAWTIAYPAMAALLPRTIARDDLAAANGLLSTVESLAWIAGPGLGGLVVTAAGLRAAIGVQAGLAALGLVVASVALRGGARSAAAEAFAPVARSERERLRHAVLDGIRTVRSTPAVHHPLALLLVSNVVYGALQVLMLVVAWQRLGMSEGGYGALCAGLGAGAFAALVVVGPASSLGRPEWVLAGSVLLGGLPVALLAIAQVPATGIVLLAVSGLGLVVTEVLALTALQRNLPVDRIAGVFGLLDSLTVTAMLVGSVAVGPVIASAGLEAALVVVGALVPVLAVVALPQVVRRRTARTTASGTAVIEEVQVIAGGSSPGAAVRNYILNR